MRLPTPLLRHNPDTHKNDFGHVLVIAGSQNMMGAAALTSLAAMRSGAGLTTLGIPKSLNDVAQKKVSSVIMTLPLDETKDHSLSLKAFQKIKDISKNYKSLVLGPGLSQDQDTQKLIYKILRKIQIPMVIDADALNAIAKDKSVLSSLTDSKVLTPHPGEMSRLTSLTKTQIEKNRRKVALEFSRKYRCILLLKGHRTVVASPDGRFYINKSGNAGMATAGSGDVLSGMIGAFLAQGLAGFDAAKYAAFLHGKAGDQAARKRSKTSLIATDIIDELSQFFR